MDKTTAQKIVKAQSPRYIKLFHLNDWKVTFKYNWIGEEGDLTFGTCTTDPSYKHATIVINPELLEDEIELVKTLRHELIHVLHSSFDIYRDTVQKLVSSKEFDALDTVFHYACEDAVMFIENILDKELKLPLMKGKR